MDKIKDTLQAKAYNELKKQLKLFDKNILEICCNCGSTNTMINSIRSIHRCEDQDVSRRHGLPGWIETDKKIICYDCGQKFNLATFSSG